MKALERTPFDKHIGQAGSDSTVIDSVRRKRGMMTPRPKPGGGECQE